MKEKKKDTEVSNGGPSATDPSLWSGTTTFPLYCFILKVYLILFEADLQPLWRPVSTHYNYTQEINSWDELKPKAWAGSKYSTVIWGEQCDLSIKSQSQKHSLRVCLASLCSEFYLKGEQFQENMSWSQNTQTFG